MPTVAAWETMAATALGELADREGAFVMLEAEAKISDQGWPTIPRAVNPHHVTNALRRLVAAGNLTSTVAATRGGREIRVYHRPIQRGLARRIENAAARKRLLHTRYLAWATGTKDSGSGAIGPGLEIVLHKSLQAAAQFGYRLLNPTAVSGEVRTLLGAPVPGGSLDNGAWLTTISEGFAPTSKLVVIEAKNIRQWIYPHTQELHQLLAKAAALQIAHPGREIVPVLVCRRASYLTNLMAEQLGFYVIQTQRQYVRPHLVDTAEGRAHVDQVNTELGYDLVPFDAPVDPLVRHFRTPLQAVADRTAQRWAITGPVGATTFAWLRDESITYGRRHELLDELAQEAAEAHGDAMAWRREPEW